MAKKKLLIVTRELDPHADMVILRMRERGIEPIRFHPKDFLAGDGCSVSISKEGLSASFNAHPNRFSFADIGAIWWRRPAIYKPSGDLSPREEAFAARETNETLSGVWSAIDCYWMSRPDKIYRGSKKIEQLERARKYGFEIPRTIVTNNKERLQAFVEECDGKMIYKVLSTPDLGLRVLENRGVKVPATEENAFTTKTTFIDRTTLAKHLDAVSSIPCLFQEYIEKRVELRVTFFEDKVFVAEIDSQAQEATKIDWRHYEVPMLLKEGSLPADVISKCYSYMKSYGLSYSSMDLIVTPDGRIVFVENNPNGQWMWVENQLPQLKMKDALIDCLVKGAGEC